MTTKKFHISRWTHNDFFPHRKLEWWARAEYTINDHEIVVHKYVNLIGLSALSMVAPLYIIKNGWKDVVNFFKDKWTNPVGEIKVKHWNDLYDAVNLHIRMNGGWK